MSELRELLTRQARREQRRPRLVDALLSDRAWAYIGYRLRYMVMRTLLISGLHLAEVFLFASIYSLEYIGPVLFARSVTAVAASLWWGGLEQLRTAVREAAAKHQWHTIRRLTHAWVGVGIILGTGSVVGTTVWALTHPDPRWGFSVFQAYAIACVIRMAIDLPVRAYHSGLYALRRIWRPLWSLILPDVLDLALVLALWRPLGPWSFPPTLLAVGILRATLTLDFTSEAYRHTRIRSGQREQIVQPWKALGWQDLKGFAIYATMNLSAQLDGSIVAVLVATGGDERMSLTALLYILRPLVGSAFRWTRLFYFDFKRLQTGYSHLFRQRFAGLLQRVALVSAGTIGVITLGGAALLWHRLELLHVLLVPFFAVRSLLGLFQVQAFSYDQHRYLIKMAAGCGVLLLAIGHLPLGAVSTLVVMILFLTVLLIWLGAPAYTEACAGELRQGETSCLPYLLWLRLAAGYEGSVRVSMASLRGTVREVRHIAESLARAIPFGAVCHPSRHTLLWMEASESEELIDRERLVVVAAGRMEELRFGEVCDSGRAALRDLPQPVAKLAGPRSQRLARVTPAILRAGFARRFPDGVCLDVQSGRLNLRPAGTGPGMGSVDSSDLWDVLRATAASAHAKRKKRTAGRSKLDVTVYGPGGEPELIFAVEPTAEAKARERWRSLVRTLNAHHTVIPPQVL